MTKIILLVEHELFRVGVTAILKEEKSFAVVGGYRTFASFKSLVPTLAADLVFVDLSLEEDHGLEVAKYIKNTNPRLKVVILSSYKEEFYVLSAIESGVDGYIHKDIDPTELISGVKNVMKGKKFFSSAISKLLINTIYRRRKGTFSILTQKEKEVVQYLMDGFSSKEIADKLDCSPRTVESHRANVLNKFNLKNTAELIKRMMEQKIRF